MRLFIVLLVVTFAIPAHAQSVMLPRIDGINFYGEIGEFEGEGSDPTPTRMDRSGRSDGDSRRALRWQRGSAMWSS